MTPHPRFPAWSRARRERPATAPPPRHSGRGRVRRRFDRDRDWKPGSTSAEFQGGEPGDRKHDREDPKAGDNFRLVPAKFFEGVMQRRHGKEAPAGELE